MNFGFGERVRALTKTVLLLSSLLLDSLQRRHRPCPHDSHRRAPASGAHQPAVSWHQRRWHAPRTQSFLRCLPLEAGMEPLTPKDAELLRKQARLPVGTALHG